ncbi:lipopolysaccharide biosynthesis protein [Actinomycetospora flava]|uniref:Lipopolysaccharide biosynthesis protein n=1 Tax=Actinomycetospora flava TaxID=3129232 RepID=A0ABU8M5M7_9PSEU
MQGVAWRGLTTLATRLLRVGVFFVLARLLAPEAFGTVALAVAIITVLQFLASGGLSQAIIQHPALTKSHLDSVLLISAVSGFILGGAMFFSAPIVAEWMGQQELGPVLMALSAMPVLVGANMVPEGLLSREMNFRALSIRQLAATLLSIASALALAFGGAGVWALVVQTLVEGVTSTVFLWMATVRSYRPGATISRQAVREMGGFGLKVIGIDLTVLASTKSDDILIGAVLGPSALGLYSVAYRLLTVLQDTIQGVSNTVAFPLYSRLQGAGDRLTSGFIRSAGFTFAVSSPAFVFTAVASPQLVPALLGPQWLAAAPVMSVLAIAGIATTMVDINNTFLQATGRAGQVLATSLVGSLVNVVGFILAVNYGIVWVAAAFAARAVAMVPVTTWLVSKHLGAIRGYLSSLAPLVLLLSVPILAGVGVGLVDEAIGNDLVSVILCALPGLGLYCAGLRLLSPTTFEDLRLVIMKATGRTKKRERKAS